MLFAYRLAGLSALEDHYEGVAALMQSGGSYSGAILRLANRPALENRKGAMPRDGSMILSDIRGPTLAIVCEPRARRGR
jgi:hypothetical protein